MSTQDFAPENPLPGELSGFRQFFTKAFERSAIWMHVSAALTAFASDVLTPLLHHLTTWLFATTFVLAASVLFFARRTILRSEFASALTIFLLMTAILSLGVWGLQRLEGGPANGAFAKMSETIEGLQKSLNIMGRKLDVDIDTNTRLLKVEQKLLEVTARQKGVPFGALQPVLTKFGKTAAEEDPGKIVRLFNEKADQYIAMRAELDKLAASDPHTQSLQQQAKVAYKDGKLDLARAKLQDSAQADIAAAEELGKRAKARAGAAASTLEQSAGIASVALQYREAAADLAKAATLVSPFDRHLSWRLTWTQGQALRHQGDEFGDNAALIDAIAVFRQALTLTSPEAPTEWAKTQNSLGFALRVLGEREDNGKHLEEAAAAYREALGQQSREQNSIAWGKTQHDLANVLEALGERESGNGKLEEASKAYQAALNFQSRERTRTDWASTWDDYGGVLSVLGDRKNDLKLLRQAVEAHRRALTAYTLKDEPFDWAAAQNNLAESLCAIGKRDGGLSDFLDAQRAYLEAFKVYTQKRAPLDWAMTKSNLAETLDEIGRRETGVDAFNQAILASQEALTEYTFKRDPFDWAIAQYRLANALSDLGSRVGDAARLTRAIDAYSAALTVWTVANAPSQHDQAVAGRDQAKASLSKMTTHK